MLHRLKKKMNLIRKLDLN